MYWTQLVDVNAGQGTVLAVDPKQHAKLSVASAVSSTRPCQPSSVRTGVMRADQPSSPTSIGSTWKRPRDVSSTFATGRGVRGLGRTPHKVRPEPRTDTILAVIATVIRVRLGPFYARANPFAKNKMQCEQLDTKPVSNASQLANAVCCFRTPPCTDSAGQRVHQLEKSAAFSCAVPKLGRVRALHAHVSCAASPHNVLTWARCWPSAHNVAADATRAPLMAARGGGGPPPPCAAAFVNALQRPGSSRSASPPRRSPRGSSPAT